MKASQLRELSKDELQQKEQDLYQGLVNLRVQATLGQAENPLRLRSMRRELARVKTLIKEVELKAQA